MKPILLTALSLLIALLIPVKAQAEAISVVVPSEVEVSGLEIILGDIASIDLPPDTDPETSALAQRLGKISLGKSPGPGQSLTLRSGQIEQRLRESGENLAATDWHLPETLKVTRRGEALSDKQISDIVEDYLKRSEPYQSGEFRILSLTSGPKPALPPEGQVEWDFSAQPSSNPTYLTGNLFFKVDGREIGRVRVTAQIELNVPAVVVVHNMSRGAVISEDDLSLTLAPFNKAKGSLTDPSLAVGSALKTNLPAGTPLKERDLTKSTVIKRGDMVTIIAKSGGLTVTAVGQAKQDGSFGDTISVMNQDSKKTIAAKVLGPNRVEVVF